MTNIDVGDLDHNQQMYQDLDPSGMGNRLGDLPRQCQEGWSLAMNAALPELRAPVRHVVIGGMGGSAIAGDLVADLAAAQPGVPITVVRDTRFPFAVDQSTLFIGCSHSGRTRETFSLFNQAIKHNAQVVAMVGGGPLVKGAPLLDVPLLKIAAPGEPRSAVGYSLMLLLGALRRLGILHIDDAEVAQALALLGSGTAQYGRDIPHDDNPAKQLAGELKDRLVVVYGGGLFAGLARRWKSQLNENAKVWAFFETVPELLHNAVEAYGSALAPSRDIFVLVLEPGDCSADLQHRYRVTRRLLQQKEVPHRVVPGVDGPPLAQVLTMLSLGDYVSYYLALLQELDPATNRTIDLGKAILGEVTRST